MGATLAARSFNANPEDENEKQSSSNIIPRSTAITVPSCVRVVFTSFIVRRRRHAERRKQRIYYDIIVQLDTGVIDRPISGRYFSACIGTSDNRQKKKKKKTRSRIV